MIRFNRRETAGAPGLQTGGNPGAKAPGLHSNAPGLHCKAAGLHLALALFALVAIAVPAAAQVQSSSARQVQTTPTPAPTASPTPTPTFTPVRERERWFFGRPALRIGQDYRLRAGEEAREVVVVLGDVHIEGRVTRDVVVVLGDVTLAASAVIDRSLVVVGGSATVQQGASVSHDLVIVGGTLDAPHDFAPRGEHVVVGAPIIGRSLRALVPWLTRGLLWGRLIVPDIRWNWVVVGIAFLLGLLLNHVFYRQVTNCAETLARRPFSTFFVGLLALLLMPPILTLVAATVIGLVVVPFAFLAFILGGMIGKVGVTRAIGTSVVSESEGAGRGAAARSFVLGSALIVIAYMLPIVGVLTWAMLTVLGFGAATLTFMGAIRRERAVPPPPAAPTASGPGPSLEPMAPAPPPVPAPAPSHYATAVTSEPAPSAAPHFDYDLRTGSPADSRTEPAFTPRPIAGLAGYPRATFFDRLAAIALDVVLVAIAVSFIDRGWNDGPGVFFLLLLTYHVAFWAWKGTTLGGIICNLRVVRMHDGDVRFVDALVRGLASIFSVVALGIGCFWMLTDREAQMWHDKIAGTIVVKVPRELVLE
jgi:uncharacterized RDD family membrane protein YckC